MLQRLANAAEERETRLGVALGVVGGFAACWVVAAVTSPVLVWLLALALCVVAQLLSYLLWSRTEEYLPLASVGEQSAFCRLLNAGLKANAFCFTAAAMIALVHGVWWVTTTIVVSIAAYEIIVRNILDPTSRVAVPERLYRQTVSLHRTAAIHIVFSAVVLVSTTIGLVVELAFVAGHALMRHYADTRGQA